MKKHTKIYMNYFGFKIAEDMFCEICGKAAKDIHHIKARGMGGNPSGDKDVIENIMAVCRKCHEDYGDKEPFREMLQEVHLNFMKIYGRKEVNKSSNNVKTVYP